MAAAHNICDFPHRKVINRAFERKRFGAGIILTTGDSWCVIRRQNSNGFISILLGNYALHDAEHMMEDMTIEEEALLRGILSGDRQYTEVASKVLLGVTATSENRFVTTKPLLRRLLKVPRTYRKQTPWSWPKGRVESDEDWKRAAWREFEEETGVAKGFACEVLELKITEEFRRMDAQSKVRYLTVLVDQPIELPALEEKLPREIGERAWVSTDVLLASVADYRAKSVIRIQEYLHERELSLLRNLRIGTPPSDSDETGELPVEEIIPDLAEAIPDERK